MSEYHTEGFVKIVSKEGKGVEFTVEASAPYLFESEEKREDGSAKRKILLVAEGESNVRIYSETVEFRMEDCEFAALLIAKANHMKVRITVDGRVARRNYSKVLDVYKFKML